MISPRPSPGRRALLGATGSIGPQVWDLVERNPDRFRLHVLIAGSDAAALQAVARRHPEAHALLAHPADARGGEAGRAVDDARPDPPGDPVIVAPPRRASPGPPPAPPPPGQGIPPATQRDPPNARG